MGSTGFDGLDAPFFLDGNPSMLPFSDTAPTALQEVKDDELLRLLDKTSELPEFCVPLGRNEPEVEKAPRT